MSQKRSFFTGWKGGSTAGVLAVVVLSLGVFSIQKGGMKNLHGKDIVRSNALSDIAPAAGDSHVHDEEDHSEHIINEDEVIDEGVSEGDHSHDHHGHSHADDIDFEEPPPPITDCGVYHDWIAKPFDREALEALDKVNRVLLPGQVMTMDYNPERVNVYINRNNIVLDVKCG